MTADNNFGDSPVTRDPDTSASSSHPQAITSGTPSVGFMSECQTANIEESVTEPAGSVAKPIRSDSLPMDFGPFELLEELGRGGMGVVYKARQRSLNRLVAIKMIKEGATASEKTLLRFVQEARAAAALDHENIVPIYEIGEYQGQHYFTMGYVEGSSLTGLVRSKGSLSPSEAVPLLLAVADAVEAAHLHGIVHRDLKPDNVLIDRKGRPRVTDFGLAKIMEGGADLTHSGQILGTPTYMAPEQAQGGPGSIGPFTDVYALGGVMFFVLTGQAPFLGQSVTEVLCKVLTQPARSLRDVNPTVPEALEAVCRKCLSKEPANRYASAAEFGSALAAAAVECGCITSMASLSASHVTAQDRAPASISSSAPRTDREAESQTMPIVSPGRGPLLWAALAAVLVIAAGVTTYVLWPTHQDNKNPGAVANKDDTTKDDATKDNSINKDDGSKKDDGKPNPRPIDESILLPAPRRQDFGLKVEMIGVKPDKMGVYTLQQDDEMKLHITVDQDAYIGIWSIDPQGRALMLFPNYKDDNYFIKAGQPLTLPRMLFGAATLFLPRSSRPESSKSASWRQVRNGTLPKARKWGHSVSTRSPLTSRQTAVLSSASRKRTNRSREQR